MVKRMLIDATHPEETRVVVLDGDKVEEFDFESVNKRQIAGNIYLAKVTRIEPSLQAAFVDYGGNRHGFLPFSEIHPDYYQIPRADREAVIEAEAEEREARSEARAEAAEEAASGPALEEVGEEDRAPAAEETAEIPAEIPAEANTAAPGEGSAGEGTTDAAEEPSPTAQAESMAAETVARSAPVTEGEAAAVAPEVEAGAEATAPSPETGEEAEAGRADESVAVPGMDVIDLAEDGEAPLARPLGSAGADLAEEAEAAPKTASPAEAEARTAAPAEGAEAQRTRKPRRRYKIQEVIKVRQIMLVQVVKEERGNKGAALTTYLSLAGRYCVLMPNTPRGGGISRKITNAADRKKLKAIADEIKLPDGSGLIIRTAGAKRTKSEIKRDYEYLLRQWDQIRELTLKSIAPAPIYEEGNLIKRAIRDLYTRDIEEVLVEGEKGYRTAKDFMRMLIPSHAKKVKHYTDPVPLFARYQVENYLASMFNPTVRLPSGGYIVIDTTEALVAIDVNSGKSTRQGSVEETALKTNLEAADEIARQLKLRDLAGLIVIDFIDMDDRRNRAAVEKRLKERLKGDRARIQVGRISSFGLLEMSRQRLRPGMLEMVSQPCPHCHGTGIIRSDESLSLAILRQIEEEAVKGKHDMMTVTAPVSVANYLINEKRSHILGIEERYGITVRIDADPGLVPPDYRVDKSRGHAETATPSKPVVSVDTALAGPTSVVEEVREEIGAPEIDGAAESESEGNGRKRKRRRRSRRRGRGNAANGTGNAATAGAESGGGENQDRTVSSAEREGGSQTDAEPAGEQAESSAPREGAPAPVVEAASSGESGGGSTAVTEPAEAASEGDPSANKVATEETAATDERATPTDGDAAGGAEATTGKPARPRRRRAPRRRKGASTDKSASTDKGAPAGKMAQDETRKEPAAPRSSTVPDADAAATTTRETGPEAARGTGPEASATESDRTDQTATDGPAENARQAVVGK